MKMKFDPTVTLGNLIAAISFLLPATVYGIGFVNRFNMAEKDITEMKQVLKELSKTTASLSESQHIVAALLDAHSKTKSFDFTK